MNKAKYILLSMVIVPILFFAARNAGFLGMGNFIESRNCKDEVRLRNNIIKGQVTDKFRDSDNHNVKTIILKLDDGTTKKSSFLMLDISGAYDDLRIGDRIEKNSGSLVLAIQRGSSQHQIQLDYNCRKE